MKKMLLCTDNAGQQKRQFKTVDYIYHFAPSKAVCSDFQTVRL